MFYDYRECRFCARQLMSLRLLNSISAEFLTAAFFAVGAHPKRVELFDGGFNNLRVVREDSRFEVATEGTFHADACAGQVSGANVGGFEVENHHLEMHSRTHDAFEVGRENLIAVEIFAEVRAGFLGVNQSYAYAALEQSGELSEQRYRFAVLLHINILDVGGADPERFADCRDTGNHFGIVFFVLDVLGERRHRKKYSIVGRQ